MDNTPFSANSTSKLNEAMRKLEDYSQKQSQLEEIPSVSKTMGLVRSILAGSFNTRLKKHDHQLLPPNKNEVLTAIEFINRNRLFIEKLKEGTPAEQELAERYTKTIDNYNENCDKRIQGCIADRSRLANFFLKDKQKEQVLPKIAMIKKVTVQHQAQENSTSKTLSNLALDPEVKMCLSKQLAELFHMKTISLLERRGIASNPEARPFIKNSPIYTTVEKNTSICTLTQTLSLFPGQTIVIKGNSTLDPKTQTISRLLPESFSLKLTQIGFPHPTQRAGWTVASQLLPEAPQRIDLLEKTAELFQRKNQAVAELQQENLLTHAKTLLSLKKKAFQENAEEFIGMHEILATAILQASSADPKVYDTVNRFYHSLRNHPNPFDAIAETSQTIRECFMNKPHQMLLDAIIKGKSTDLGSDIPESRYVAAKIILDKAIDSAAHEFFTGRSEIENAEEQIISDYIRCIGTIFGKAAKPIFLKYLSEDLIFEPPSLTAFESKVLDAAYLHLKDFLDELSITLGDDQAENQRMAYHLLKKQISSDIALFKGESLPAISGELENYFLQRYQSLSFV
jgi:hypothetical protein